MKIVKTVIMLVSAVALLLMDYACALVSTVLWYIYPVILGVRLAILRKMFNINGLDGDKLALYGLNTAVSYVNDTGKDFIKTAVHFGRFRR